MSVGHGGNDSKHTGLEKLFILEYLEAKFQAAVNWYNKNQLKLGDLEVSCQVFDPYNSGMDFFILVNTKGKENFSDTYAIYEKIHSYYQTMPKFEPTAFFNDWTAYLEEIHYPGGLEGMMGKTMDGFDRIHASSSQTISLYSIEQMAKFYGIERSRVYNKA